MPETQAALEMPAQRRAWTPTQWAVVAFFCSIAFIAYVQRLSVSVTIQPVQSDFGLSIRQKGWLLAAFAWGYAIAQIPTGWLTDRWGVRRTLTLAAFVWSSALGLQTIANGFLSSWFLWFAVGVAQSCAFSGATRGFRSWLPVDSWARANGGLGAAMFLGGGVTTALTAALLISTSWREIYALYATIGIAWSLLFWHFFRDDPDSTLIDASESLSIATENNDVRKIPPGEDLSTLQILKMPAVWALIAQQFFRCSPYVFFASLFPSFLQEHRGLSLQDSGFLSSLPLFSTLIGCLVSGVIADRLLVRFKTQLASRRATAIFGLALAATSILAALWVTNPVASTLVMCLGTFGSAFAGVAAFTATMDIGQQRVGTVFGLMNTAGNIGGAISPIIAGEIIARWGNWNIIIALAAALYLASMASWIVLGSTSAAPQAATSTIMGDITPLSQPRPDLEILSLESPNVRC